MAYVITLLNFPPLQLSEPCRLLTTTTFMMRHVLTNRQLDLSDDGVTYNDGVNFR
jgi:hypothetical protein